MTAKETAYQINQFEVLLQRLDGRTAAAGVLDMTGTWLYIVAHDQYLQKVYPDLILSRTWNRDRAKTCTHAFSTHGGPAEIDKAAQTVTFTTRYRNETTGEIEIREFTLPFNHLVTIEVL